MKARAADYRGSLIALLMSLWALCPPAHADARHTFWEVKGAHNTLYVFGSVHVLKPADSALPEPVLAAYARSKGLVMELDLNQIDAAELTADTSLETLPEGETLEGVLGAPLYQKFSAQAKPLGLDPDSIAQAQPWFAAMLFEQLELTQSGFQSAAGIDEQMAARAEADHKPIIGLETMSEQLGFFAHLSLEQQKQYLRETLAESATDERDTAEVIQAWKSGDTAKLEQLLREGSAESPELYHLLTTERNQRWLPKIEQLLAGTDDYLVVVGALHLVGKEGLIELLRSQGYQPQQR